MRFTAVHSACLLSLCTLTSGAIAQAAAPDAPASAASAATPTPPATPAKAADGPQEVVVTGSYFAGPKAQKSTLETIGQEEIAKSVRPSLIQMLSQLSATQGNLIAGDSNNQGNSPVQALNLRGLGPRATLVLLNGQRQVSVSEPGGFDSFSVDISTLVPTVLVSRIDVLKDGASALYGSDAVAGVANFITRKDIDGIVLDGAAGMLDAKGRKNGHVGMGYGAHTDTTTVIGGVELSHQDQIYVRDVFNDPARIAKFGQTSAFANPGTYFVGGVAYADPLCGDSSLGSGTVPGLLVSGKCRQDLTLNRGMVAETDKVLGYFSVDHDLSDNLTLNAEIGASHVSMHRSNSVGYPINSTTIVVPASNPGNPFGADAIANLRWGSAVDDNHAMTDTESNTYRGKIGVDGKLGKDWNYTLSVSEGVNESAAINGGYPSVSRLEAALNCKGGTSGDECYNPFASAYLAAPGSALANPQSLVDWITVARMDDTRYSLRTYDALTTGTLLNLWNGRPLKLAVGLQRREEKAEMTNDFESKSTDVGFGGAATDYSVKRSVNAAFTELRIPLAATFELDAAGRFEKSDPGVGTFNPKLGFNWSPTSEFSVAGSIGHSERAPGLLQYTGGSGLTNINYDPITKNAQNGVSVTTLPSTGLKPESSVNSNLGVIWNHPTSIGDFNVNLDYFTIDFRKLITGVDTNALVLANPNDPAITRDPVTGQIQMITVPGFYNSNELKLAGLDFNLRYGTKVGMAKVFAAYDGTLMHTYKFRSGATTSNFLGTYDTAVAPVPRLASRLSVGASAYGTDVTLTDNYKSKLRETSFGLTGITEEKSYTTYDLAISHSFSKDTIVNVGVLNLLNKLPPAQANSIYTENPLVYAPFGRSFQAGFRTAF